MQSIRDRINNIRLGLVADSDATYKEIIALVERRLTCSPDNWVTSEDDILWTEIGAEVFNHFIKRFGWSAEYSVKEYLSLEDEIKELRDENSNLEDEISDYKADNENMKDMIDDLKDQKSELEDTINSLEKQIEDLEQELRDEKT